ncbi:MAG: sugar ABC transporter permease [Chloroflexi bacterium]|uniref:Sugar ABC transporter permease n=1 Tax=Candidatus Chlorohelix allophototropha TaxID=3003348 RepID=A0A8T7M0L5_9CHLR|nr:sugar ABC transporter permease [Chloroflexota bacterium]WJW67272.1 sugar ABC transporter permease [Chloroflexota bacterium L227-S17]
MATVQEKLVTANKIELPGENSAEVKRRKFRKMLRSSLKAYLFIAPALIILFFFHFMPIIYAFFLSLYKRISAVKGIVPPAENFAGFDNYSKLLFDDPDWWNAFWNTLGYVALSVFLGIAAALGVALMLDKVTKGKNLYRTLFFLPYVTSLIAIAAVWNIIFAPFSSNALTRANPDRPGGLANWVFAAIGIPMQRWRLDDRGILKLIFDNGGRGPDVGTLAIKLVLLAGLMSFIVWLYRHFEGGIWNWLTGLLTTFAALVGWSVIVELAHFFTWDSFWGGPSMAMFTMVIISTWHILGFNTVLLLAGLTNISRELYDAAKIDGARGWQMFTKMTIPLLSPTLFFMVVVGTIGAFQSFTLFFAIYNGSSTNRSTTVLSIFYYDVTFGRGSGSDTSGFGYSSTIVMMMLVIIMGISFVQQRILGKRVNYD